MKDEIKSKDIFINKEDREALEIEYFREMYKRITGKILKIRRKLERPDYELEDPNGKLVGVELTSAYINNKSVPNLHMKEITGTEGIEENNNRIKKYQSSLCEKISEKIHKANNSKEPYGIYEQLFLFVYINEYEAIYLDNSDDWINLFKAKENKEIFSNIYPFTQIYFCPYIDKKSRTRFFFIDNKGQFEWHNIRNNALRFGNIHSTEDWISIN